MNVLFNAILSFLNAGLMVYIFMLFFSAFAAPRFSTTVRALLSAGIIAAFTVLLMILGTAIMIPVYPIYRRIARKTKAELTPEILRLSEEIMKSEKI